LHELKRIVPLIIGCGYGGMQPGNAFKVTQTVRCVRVTPVASALEAC
jgi:hypothetical protein